MNTTVENIAPARVKIQAEVEAEEIANKLDRAAREFGREMKMPGFRQGKVPPQLVLQRVGREAVFEHALREALPEWYEAAILDSGVSPVGEPQLDVSEIPDAGEDMTFTIEVNVRPKAELGEYKGVEVPRREVEVPEGAVDGEIERMRESFAGLQPVERAAAEGDHVLIDFTGEVDGEEFEGGQATDYLLELGSDSLIDGFEDGLVGASAGDDVDVEVTFPEEYHSEALAGKPAVFHVTMKEVREKTLPDLDDDFAADNSDFDTLDELKADIEHRIKHADEHRIEHEFSDAVVAKVAENAEMELPQQVIDDRAEELWERVERQIQQSGMDPAMYLEMQGKSRDEAIDDAAEEAEAGLRREAVLEAVAEAEAIEVSEEELLEALEPPAGQKGKPEKLLKRLRKEGRDVLVIEDIKQRKALEFLVENAVAGEWVEPPEPAEDEAEEVEELELEVDDSADEAEAVIESGDDGETEEAGAEDSSEEE